MAGARIGPISGVNWAAYGNVASLIMQAAEASARGSAALGAGIGGGLQSLGQGIQRGRERREARAERQEARADSQARWEAEFGYRQQRDAADDTRADLRLSMDAVNNERIRTQGEIELLNRLMETSTQKATLADQTGNVAGLQAALAEVETLGAERQRRLAKMLKINALPGTQPTAAQPANVGPVDWEGLFANSAQGTQGRAFLQRQPSAETQRDAATLYPGSSSPAASSAIERRGETPSMARNRMERAEADRQGAELAGRVPNPLEQYLPLGAPAGPMPVVQNAAMQAGLTDGARAELVVNLLKGQILSLEQGKQALGNKTPQDLIAKRAHDRAQQILVNATLPYAATADIGKRHGMAVAEYQQAQTKVRDEAKKKADEADLYSKELDLRVKGAFAAFRAKFGRDPTPEEAPLVLDQVRAKITPDAAVENFVKPDKPKDDDRPVRLRKAVDSISGALAQAEKAAKEDNSLESISGGAPPAPKPPNLSGLVTDDVAEVVNAGPGASSPEVYAAAKAELERRGVKPGSVSAAAPKDAGVKDGAVSRVRQRFDAWVAQNPNASGKERQDAAKRIMAEEGL